VFTPLYVSTNWNEEHTKELTIWQKDVVWTYNMKTSITRFCFLYMCTCMYMYMCVCVVTVHFYETAGYLSTTEYIRFLFLPTMNKWKIYHHFCSPKYSASLPAHILLFFIEQYCKALLLLKNVSNSQLKHIKVYITALLKIIKQSLYM